jgi:hypothetical protein
MTTSQDARALLQSQYPGKSLGFYQTLGAIARFETGYSDSLGGNNWGSVMCNHVADSNGECGPGCQPHQDHKADGTLYMSCFKVYDTPEQGLTDFVETVKSRMGSQAYLLDQDTVYATDVAQAMHDGHYFVAAVTTYADAIYRNAKDIANMLGESLDVDPGSGGILVIPSNTTLASMTLAGAAGFALAGPIGLASGILLGYYTSTRYL